MDHISATRATTQSTPDTDSEGAPIEYYTVNCLMLHWHRFWGVLCEECRTKYHSKLPIVDEDAADKRKLMGVRQELSQEVKGNGTCARELAGC